MERPLVLVTRSGAAGQRLAAAVRDEGFESIHCPPLEPAAMQSPESARARLLDTLPADRLIFTSAFGVRQAVALAGGATLAGRPCVVPGSGTAAVARELGLEPVVFPPSRGNSEAMLALPELTAVAGLHIVIAAAAGGRGMLAEELARRGARVSVVHVYRRLARRLPDDLNECIAAATEVVVLAASAAALRGLHRGLGRAATAGLDAARVIAPSSRVAELARELGHSRVATAEGADDRAMLTALTRHTA